MLPNLRLLNHSRHKWRFNLKTTRCGRFGGVTPNPCEPRASQGWGKNKVILTVYRHLVPPWWGLVSTLPGEQVIWAWSGIRENLVISQFPGKRLTFQSFLVLCSGLISNQDDCLPLPSKLDIWKCRNRLGSNLKIGRKLKPSYLNTKYKHLKENIWGSSCCWFPVNNVIVTNTPVKAWGLGTFSFLAMCLHLK